MSRLYPIGESKKLNVASSHKNIMELLVQEEIEKQLKDYSCRLKPYINKVEVATFALNRLPPLYASTVNGKNYQTTLAQKYQQQIKIAVSRGIAAVERDPLRSSTPIISEVEIQYQRAKQALKELEYFLRQKGLLTQSYLSWGNMVLVVLSALKKISWLKQQKAKDSEILTGNISRRSMQ